MLRNLKSQQRTRLLNKFTENDCEKVDRLMELYFKYLEAVQQADKRIEGEKHEMVRRGEILDDSMEDEFYLRRLDAGLFVLQLLCYIMVEISSSGVSQLQQRVHQILNIRGGSVKVVRHIMRVTQTHRDASNAVFFSVMIMLPLKEIPHTFTPVRIPSFSIKLCKIMVSWKFLHVY
ncbi:beta-catenin-like protein 1 [Poecilia latipinna]|uniref:beta-catenin-like protein 1 n=1 Tax=Poecilia latipinna TaxID=48699 RepID=UPI00072E52A2|nr:PREDICTED: beta-catenin-like protein 1 [Poecilia latipinna]